MTEHKNLTAKKAIQNFQKAFGYTNEAIKRALACCGSIDKDCENCVFCDEKGCEDMLKRAALDLINRQMAEIEDYQHLKVILNTAVDKLAADIKAKAIKEFAERLKERHYFHASCVGNCYQMSGNNIDNLVKEMTEGAE